MLFILRLLSLLPARLLAMLGWLLGWLIYLGSPTYRRRFGENAKQAGYDFSQVKAAVGHAGRMGTELPKIWSGKPQQVDMDSHTRAALDEARASQRGILMLTPHIGCFELAVQAISLYWGDDRGPITVLYRPARKEWLATHMKTIRNRFGIEAVPTDLGGVRAMLKRLRSGGCVGLLPDQVPPYGLGIWAPFFGRPAYSMTIAARLIAQTNPVILTGRCERKPLGGGYTLKVQRMELDEMPECGADAASQRQQHLVNQINLAMEQQIRACPTQYLWAYARYKKPRGMPASKPTGEN